jgi:hypothetical protein
MKIRGNDFQYLISILIILYYIKKIACIKKAWDYYKCKNYLKTLNIICNKIQMNEIYYFCENWETKIPSDINIIPKICQNKIYVLPLLIKNFDPPIIEESIIYIKIQKTKEIEKYEKPEEIEQCLEIFDNYDKFNEIYLINKDDVKIDKKSLLENIKRFNKTIFCVDFSIYIINNMIKNLSKNVNNKKFRFNKFLEEMIENTDFEDDDNDFKEENNYFENYENRENFNDSNEKNVKENYEKDSDKDCKYSLKSPNEEALVCNENR